MLTCTNAFNYMQYIQKVMISVDVRKSTAWTSLHMCTTRPSLYYYFTTFMLRAAKAWMWPRESTALLGCHACFCRGAIYCLHVILRMQMYSHKFLCSIICSLSNGRNLSSRQKTLTLEYSRLEGSWAIPFLDWLRVRHSVLPIKKAPVG